MSLMRPRHSGNRSPGQSGSPFTERGFVASAAVVGFVVLAAVVTLMTDPPATPGASSGESSATSGPTTGAATTPRAGATARADAAPRLSTALQPDGTCAPSPSQGTDAPVSQPADARWDDFGGYLVPQSASVGPGVVNGDIARCYVRTPMGAVFAALNGSLRYRQTSDWGAAAQYLLAPGPGRDAYIQQRASGSGPNARPEPVPIEKNVPQPRGFRVLERSLDRVRVDIVAEPFEGGPTTHTEWTVVWVENDWRIELPPGGEPPPAGHMDPDQPFVALNPG